MIAALAAFGYSEVKVYKRPRVTVVPTGSELVDSAAKPSKSSIRDSNSPMLQALSEASGGSTRLLKIVADDRNRLERAISAAVKTSDILLITGGVSVGKYDHTKEVLESLGAEFFFRRVRLKPGKPTVFAKIGDCLIFGLPGNPVSAAVGFTLFVRSCLYLMQSSSLGSLNMIHCVLAANIKAAAERDTYLPARLTSDGKARIIATPVKWLGSSDFVSFGKSDALVIVPAGNNMSAGDIVPAIRL